MIGDTSSSPIYFGNDGSSYDAISKPKSKPKAKKTDDSIGLINDTNLSSNSYPVISLKMQPNPNKSDRPLTKVSDPYSDVTQKTHEFYGTKRDIDNQIAVTHDVAYQNADEARDSSIDIHDITKPRSYLPKPKDTCSNGVLWWLTFNNARDYVCLFIASIFYAVIVLHWNSDNASVDDKVGAFFIVLWLGCCCGWVWRHTNSVFASAILNSLILFVAINVFARQSTPLCNGAC